MKILVVTNMYPGANQNHVTQGIFVEEQVQALRVAGGDVDVLTIDGFRRKFSYLESLVRVMWAVKGRRYDIVHYHFGLSAISAPLVKLGTGARVFVTFHGSDVMGGGLTRIASLLAAKFSDVCIVVSEEIRGRLGAIPKACFVIPCAVNEIFFSPNLNREDRDQQGQVVVFPSSPKRAEKDYPLFTKTLEIVRSRWGINVTERHIDGLSRVAVRELLDTADCMLMTSHREGSPQSVKEAMSMRLPVVSVNVGDVGVMLKDCPGNAVVASRDPEILAQQVAGILTLGTRSKGRDRLSELGYFSGNIACRLMRLYEDVVEGRLPDRNSGAGTRTSEIN